MAYGYGSAQGDVGACSASPILQGAMHVSEGTHHLVWHEMSCLGLHLLFGASSLDNRVAPLWLVGIDCLLEVSCSSAGDRAQTSNFAN